LSAVDILDVTTKVPLERKHEEKIILKFRNPASQQHAPGQGTLEKPFVSTPPPQQKTGSTTVDHGRYGSLAVRAGDVDVWSTYR
jgi:hypothetical protein